MNARRGPGGGVAAGLGLLAAALLLAAAAGGGRASAHGGEEALAGPLPPDGGLALLAWRGGTGGELLAAARARGCDADRFWATDAGRLLGWAGGADNAAFLARWPDGLPPGTPVLVQCRATACATGGRVLSVGFYAYFRPLSYSADGDAASPGFDEHRGYEADLLLALEAMDGAGLSFARRGIADWADERGIWLRSADEYDDYDLVGGGITILESRTRDGTGAEVVAFTSGHVAFRQSLLVRAEDAARLHGHDALTGTDRVGALAGTTGEARLLQLAGLADADGVLVAGARVETAAGEATADGSADWYVTAAGASPALEGRHRLIPPSDDLPQVIYLGGAGGEDELLAALASGEIDAVARGEIGNRDAARASGGAFAVTALDPHAEWGGFTLAAGDADLRACIDAKLGYLTDGRRLGYAEWSEDPAVFFRRAVAWRPGR